MFRTRLVVINISEIFSGRRRKTRENRNWVGWVWKLRLCMSRWRDVLQHLLMIVDGIFSNIRKLKQFRHENFAFKANFLDDPAQENRKNKLQVFFLARDHRRMRFSQRPDQHTVIFSLTHTQQAYVIQISRVLQLSKNTRKSEEEENSWKNKWNERRKEKDFLLFRDHRPDVSVEFKCFLRKGLN